MKFASGPVTIHSQFLGIGGIPNCSDSRAYSVIFSMDNQESRTIRTTSSSSHDADHSISHMIAIYAAFGSIRADSLPVVMNTIQTMPETCDHWTYKSVKYVKGGLFDGMIDLQQIDPKPD